MSRRVEKATLIPGENIYRRMRPHWVTLLRGSLLAVLITAVYVAATWQFNQWFPVHVAEADRIALVIYLICLAIWGVSPWVRWLTTHYLFTDQRIVTRSGVLRVTGEAIPLAKINSVQFSKTLLERVLGSGSLIIESAAENHVVIDNVAHVEEVQREIYTHMAELDTERRYRD